MLVLVSIQSPLDSIHPNMHNIVHIKNVWIFFCVLTVTSTLFIAYSTFKQQKQTQNALDKGIVTFQLSCLKMHEKLTRVFCCVD